MPAPSSAVGQTMSRDPIGSPQKNRREKWPLPPTVLCVEDEFDALELLECFLTAEGLSVVIARSAEEALLKVQEHLPDVIVTDYLMPAMTGLELCGRLREWEKTRRIPIIVYTALSLPAHSRLYDRTLLKPTDMVELSTQIRALLPAAPRDTEGGNQP